MKNNISNFEAKKSFSKLVMICLIPPIYIDEYWDYYIKEYCLEDMWDKFLQEYTDSKFTYESFKNEYTDIILKTIDFIRNRWSDDVYKKYNDLVNSTPQLIPEYDPKKFPDGEYLDVDIHGAVDMALRNIDIFDDEYTSTYDVFKTISGNPIFHNMKRLRLNVYNNMQDKQDYIYNIHSKVSLERLYQSGDPIIEHLNKKYQLFGKTRGDSYFYKLDDKSGLDDILGNHTYGDFFYHIDVVTAKNMKIFGKPYTFIITKDKENKINNLALYNPFIRANLSLYPFAYKLALGEELNEKDLAVGYEDEIFFHYDKSEII